MQSSHPVDQTSDGLTLDPFAAIVRSKVLHSFARLSEGDPSAALALMDERVHYTFEGDHALGGTRTDREAVARWFERLLRLLPGRFAIKRIAISGWAARATVTVVFEDTVRPAFGEPYTNHGVQVTELRWGKATRIQTYVNTALVERALRRLAEHGVDEASAPPIVGHA